MVDSTGGIGTGSACAVVDLSLIETEVSYKSGLLRAEDVISKGIHVQGYFILVFTDLVLVNSARASIVVTCASQHPSFQDPNVLPCWHVADIQA